MLLDSKLMKKNAGLAVLVGSKRTGCDRYERIAQGEESILGWHSDFARVVRSEAVVVLGTVVVQTGRGSLAVEQ